MAEYRHIADLKGPPGDKGQGMDNPVYLTAQDRLEDLDAQVYQVPSYNVARSLDLPVERVGMLYVLQFTPTRRMIRFETNIGEVDRGVYLPYEVWILGEDADRNLYEEWTKIYPQSDPDPYTDVRDASLTLSNLPMGDFYVSTYTLATQLELPVRRVGVVSVVPTTSTRRMIRFETNVGEVDQGIYLPYQVWILGEDADRNLYEEWTLIFESHAGGDHSSLEATRALTINQSGTEGYARNPDVLDRPASTLKMLTVHVARQTITDEMLDDMVTVSESDDLPGGTAPTISPGDQISYRDLMYGALLPSHNAMASVLGRAVGQLLSGSSDPLERFLDEMRATASSYGWDGAEIVSASGLGNANRLSVRHLTDLLYRIADTDQVQLEMMGAYRHTISVQGSNPRTQTVTHTIDPLGEVKIPEFVAGKTGSHGDYACLAMLWRHPDGSLHAAAITASDRPNRYSDMRALIDSAKNPAPRATSNDRLTAQMVDDQVSSTRGALERSFYSRSRSLQGVSIADRIDGLSDGDVKITESGGTVTLTLEAASLPSGFSQAGLVPEGLRPASFAYGVAFEGSTSSPSTRIVQVNPTGAVQIHGLQGGVTRGTTTWTCT